MENDYLGPRRIEGLKKEDADWQKKAHAAVLSIQELTVKYFEITARAQKGNAKALVCKPRPQYIHHYALWDQSFLSNIKGTKPELYLYGLNRVPLFSVSLTV